MTTSSSMQPIETVYQGYRFRSRLEARWAVFFTHLGVQWEYEPEAYALPKLGGYLPDFYIPSWRLFVEIKPKRERAWDESRRTEQRCLALAVGSSMPVLLIIGPPWYGDCILQLFDTDGVFYSHCSFAVPAASSYEQERRGCGLCCHSLEVGSSKKHMPMPHTGDMREAFSAARQERFGY